MPITLKVAVYTTNIRPALMYEREHGLGSKKDWTGDESDSSSTEVMFLCVNRL